MRASGMRAFFFIALVSLLSQELYLQHQVYVSTETSASRERVLNDEPLPPYRVFLEWREAHSVSALRSNPHNRIFVVAQYACPREAGNIFHDYANALLLAIMTNRTLLWRYLKHKDWENLGLSTEEECNRILRRADWIPSYDEWKKELRQSNPYKMPNELPDVLQDISHYQLIVPTNLRGLEK